MLPNRAEHRRVGPLDIADKLRVSDLRRQFRGFLLLDARPQCPHCPLRAPEFGGKAFRNGFFVIVGRFLGDYILFFIGEALERAAQGGELLGLRHDFHVAPHSFVLNLPLPRHVAVGAPQLRLGVANVESDLVEILLDGEFNKPLKFFEPDADAAQLFLAVCLDRQDASYLLLRDGRERPVADLEGNLLRFRVAFYDVPHIVE